MLHKRRELGGEGEGYSDDEEDEDLAGFVASDDEEEMEEEEDYSPRLRRSLATTDESMKIILASS